jgi:hypothetical protein
MKKALNLLKDKRVIATLVGLGTAVAIAVVVKTGKETVHVEISE